MATETSPAYRESPDDGLTLAALGSAGSPGGGARRPRTAGLLFYSLHESAAEERPQGSQYGQQGGQRQQQGRAGGNNRAAVVADPRPTADHPERDELSAQRNGPRHGPPTRRTEQQSEDPHTSDQGCLAQHRKRRRFVE